MGYTVHGVAKSQTRLSVCIHAKSVLRINRECTNTSFFLIKILLNDNKKINKIK